MQYRSSLVGLLVVALLLAAVIWVRQRAAVHPGTATGSPLPDVTLTDASVRVDDIRIVLAVSPHPPVAFQKFRVRVRAERAGAVVPLEQGRIRFEMKMPMGDHRYSLVAAPDGWQEAEVTLPRCGSGERRWFATVDGAVAGRRVTARFLFDLATAPASAP